MSIYSYDFYAPSVAVYLTDNTGVNQVPFAFRSDPSTKPVSTSVGSKAEQMARSALGYLTAVEVDINLGFIPTFRITVSPPFREAVALLESSLIEFGQNQISVQFGYRTGARTANSSSVSSVYSPVFTGLCLAPAVTLGAEPNITFNVQGFGGYAATKQGKQKTYSGSRRAIIQEISGGYFRRPPDFSFVDSVKNTDAEVSALFDETLPSVAQGYRTDWQVMLDLAREARCFIMQEDNRLKIIPWVTARLAAPDYRLSFYDYSNGFIDDRTFPILDLSTESVAWWLPGFRGVVLQEIHDKDKSHQKVVVNDENVRPAATAPGAQDVRGTDAFPDANSTDPSKYLGGLEPIPGDPASKLALEQANATVIAAKRAMGLPMTIETFGIPAISPGNTIEIVNVCNRMNRTYGVFQVTHRFTAGGEYTTRLVLYSDTSEIIKRVYQKPPVGAVNTQTAPEDSPKTTINAKGEVAV